VDARTLVLALMVHPSLVMVIDVVIHVDKRKSLSIPVLNGNALIAPALEFYSKRLAADDAVCF
jgi:hypothetical protein